MTDEIRRVLKDWFASPDGSEARQERVRARIAELEMNEEPVRKSKWPRVLALALVSMLLVGTGLAAGLSLNIFNYFSDRTPDDSFDWEKQKLEGLRDKNTLVSTSASNVPQGMDLDDVIQIQDAYYDGEVLFVGYIKGRSRTTVAWTPTEEELARSALPSAIRTKEDQPIDEAAETLIEQALDAGQPFGFKQYTRSSNVTTSFQTSDGARLWYTYATGSNYNAWPDDEHIYSMTQFMSPLPEEIHGKDRIEVLLPVRFQTTCYWFDGKELYIWDGEDEQAMLTAVIDRDRDARRGRYESAKVMLDGTETTVEAEATPYLLHVKLSADESIFVLTDTEPWKWSIYDDAGRELQKSFMRGYGPTPMRTDVHEYSKDGLYTETWLWLYGEIPETLTMEIGQDYKKDEATVTLRLAE